MLAETVLPVLADAHNNPVFFAVRGRLREPFPEWLERRTVKNSRNKQTYTLGRCAPRYNHRCGVPVTRLVSCAPRSGSMDSRMVAALAVSATPMRPSMTKRWSNAALKGTSQAKIPDSLPSRPLSPARAFLWMMDEMATLMWRAP
jgi:hypothetical protein